MAIMLMQPLSASQVVESSVFMKVWFWKKSFIFKDVIEYI